MSTARGNIGGRFMARLESSPWPVPGWFRAAARRQRPGPGGGMVRERAFERRPVPASATDGAIRSRATKRE
jgi:hypothetical protein